MITKTYKYKGYTIEKHIGGWVDIKDKKSYLIKNPKGEYVQSDYAHNRTECDNLEWAKSRVSDEIATARQKFIDESTLINSHWTRE
jgi:hypothetical protein|tara:strand:- start:1785 stop:2042 length:258 start_codon:yes stop_codon:yes gene_type:complete